MPWKEASEGTYAADRPRTGRFWFVLAALVLIAVLAAWFVLVFSRNERREEEIRWTELLKLRASTKAELLEGKIADKLTNARLAGTVAFGVAPARVASPEPEFGVRQEGALRIIATEAGFSSIDLFDSRGLLLASSSGEGAPASHRELAARVLATGEPLVDIARGEHGDDCRVFLALPASLPDVSAAVIVSEVPWSSLRSAISNTDDESTESSEIVLVRRRGSEVLYLSPLRGRKAGCAEYSLPLATPNLAASDLLERGRIAGRYVDYRGHPVLAAGQLLRGVDWGLLAKIDQDEAFAAVDSRLLWEARAGALTLISLLIAAAAILESLRRAQALHAARERESFIAALDEANDAVFFLDADQRIVATNRRAEQMYGRSREQLLDMSAAELRGPGREQLAESGLSTLRRVGEALLEAEHQAADGTRFPVEISAKKLRDSKSVAYVAIVRDLRERKRAEAELVKLSRAVVQSPVSVVITDTAGAIEYVNPKFETLTGYSMAEMRGQNPRILQSGLTPAETYREMWANLAAGREWRGELCNRKKDGSLYWESASISPIVDVAGRTTHYLAVKEDITARRDLEIQLQRSQRLEAIGRLAGGIAHDFNNLLTVIDGFTELVLSDLPADAVHRGDLLEVRAASSRAARLTRQLLAFGSRRPEARRAVPLAELLPSLIRMLERLLGEDVALDLHVEPDLPPVLADPGGLEQIVVNLAVNARDAMPAGGRIAIEAGRAALDGDEALRLGLEGAGEHVRLTVSDTGPGIAAEIRDRIFEPFFTTKEVGKGTGLGLSVVFGLVRQFHGSIELESPAGGGARFVLHFPPTFEVGLPPAAAAADPDTGGRETILWVEDDPAVRDLTRRMLSSAGYRVLVAAGPEAALSLPGFDLAAVRLLVSDVRMPGMSGPELARRLRERHPGLPVLFVSGDSGAAALDALALHAEVLAKPFEIHTLLARVREAIDSTLRS
ncbi:MAG: PAS domain S-box protein [Thermoanaerobaculia bacterium]